MLDQLLITLRDVCELLLPIIGVAALVYLVIFLRKLVAVMVKAENLLNDVDNKVNQLEKPLETVNSLCGTIDNVHIATVNGVNSAIDYVVRNFSTIVDWVKEVIEKRKANATVHFVNEPEHSEGE